MTEHYAGRRKGALVEPLERELESGGTEDIAMRLD
jgi:hypothetical protein